MDFTINHLQPGQIVLERVIGKELTKKYKGLGKFRASLPMLIRTFTNGYYNHCWLPANGYILDPDYPKAIKRDLSWASGKRVLVLELHKPLTVQELPRYNQEVANLINRKYDIFSLLFWQPIYQWSNRRFYGGNWSYNKIICSTGCTMPINRTRGYFPRGIQMDPEQLRREAPLYYKVVFEGIL
jgi:hypothetical protein